jgi:hypothetical protein
LIPVDFPQANCTLGAPQGMEDECTSLRVYRDKKLTVSCWQPGAAEREAIAAGKPVYLFVVLGGTQPPVMLQTENPWADESYGDADIASLAALGIAAEGAPPSEESR